MNLYLLRHAIAVERTASDESADSARALTAEGAKKMRRIAKGMKNLELNFDLILSSPYRRARQTAEIVARRLRAERKLKFTEHLTPRGDAGELIEEIGHLHGRPDELLLVGHEPYLSHLAARVLARDNQLRLTLKKGGLIKLAVKRLRDGPCATLEWLLTPSQLAALR